MDFISPYLQSSPKHPSSGVHSEYPQTVSEIMNDTVLTISQKQHALDRLQYDALAALTMSDDSTEIIDTKSTGKILEEITAAKRSLYHAS